jgi:hypothetical protein
MTFSVNQLRDFSTLFSRSEVLRWMHDDFDSINIKLERYNLIKKFKGTTYLNILKKTYKILEEYYPNEYVLKNEFLNKWLKDELGNSNSIIFNEFRIGKAIADLAMFNGTSKVFEIKTVLDKEYRLSNQIKEYKRIFNEVYIIIPKIHLAKYNGLDNTIGIIIYDSISKNFHLEKTSDINNKIDIDVLTQVLHTNEYKKIVKDYFNIIPKMNSFNQFEICKNLIKEIPNDELNNLFIEIMKTRKKNQLFCKKSINEFNQISLSLNLNQTEINNLILKLKNNRL